MDTTVQFASSGEVAAFCRRHGIRWLALFGSAARGTLRPDSDVDVLVEFESGRTPGFLGLASVERELRPLVGGRPVDLHTPQGLSPYFRDDVLASASVQYVAEG